MNDPTLKNETGIIRVFRSPVWLKAGPPLFFTILFLIFFSPVILTGHLLAPNDALVHGIPYYYSPRTLWTNLLFSGYPQAADPQVQTWYPLSFLFSLFPNSWNAYMVSVYVLSALFTYGYVFRLTQSRLAGLVGGLCYSMSGFMMARLGQTPLVHAAVWFPLIMWSIEEIRLTASAKWMAVGSFAVASCFLAGHPQIIVYSLPVAVAYTLFVGWTPAKSRWRFFVQIGLMIALGIGLTSVQLLPTMELASLSQRTEMVYSEFAEYSLSPSHSLTLLFPYLFGGGGFFYSSLYFGEGNRVEMVTYSGLLTLLLAAGGYMAYPAKRITRFWMAAFFVGLVLAFGRYTPLGEWLFHMPVYQKFRAPIRHFLEISLAVSVLAGYGAAGLANRRILPTQVKKILWGAAGIMMVGLTMVGVLFNRLKEQAVKEGWDSFELPSTISFAVGVPLLVFVLSSGIVFLWSRNPKSGRLKAIVLIVLVVDLGSFGWFHQWNTEAPPAVWLKPPENTSRYLQSLNELHQRMASITGVGGEDIHFLANLSLLWGVPNASGYGPLGISRVRALLGLTPEGAIMTDWESTFFAGLDILAVRYVFLPKSDLKPVKDPNEMKWARENLAIQLGRGCGISNLSSVEFVLPQDITFNRIGVVSHMVCAMDVPDREKVLNIQLFNDGVPAGQGHLLAGKDTAEWAYDCPNVRNRVGHKRPEIFESVPLQGAGGICDGHKYYSKIKISPPGSVDQLKMEMTGKASILQLDKITLIDDKSGQVLALRKLMASRRWKFKEQIWKTWVYENLNAMPRAWLVHETVQANPDEVLRAIQRSILPDGRPFDPAQTALIEEPLDFKVPIIDSSGHVEIAQMSDTRIEVKSDSDSESFLVMSDIYYPGWQVSIDDQPAHIYQTNYVLRGVRLPAGQHKVLFQFKPKSIVYGLGISLGCLLVIVGITFSGGPCWSSLFGAPDPQKQ